MVVFVVCDDEESIFVFSTRELAEEYIEYNELEDAEIREELVREK